jgi:hypothetical protein
LSLFPRNPAIFYVSHFLTKHSNYKHFDALLSDIFTNTF